MSLFYPQQTFGGFGLSYGLTPSLLHARYGLDYGERFHRDFPWRVKTLMEIDRLVHADFREIGLGFEEPFARATIEPFGHRFVPALYGAPIAYAAGEDPSGMRVPFNSAWIGSLAPWTLERLEATEQVRVVLEQAAWARAHCDRVEAERRLGFNPHAQPLTSLQNLGSVINTAVSLFGEDALLVGVDQPELLRAFYQNVTDLMLLCLALFPRIDGRTLPMVFVGDCSVSMISPAHYEACNSVSDGRLCDYASGIRARFLVHQDSGATPHLPGYAALGAVHGIDFGQDTDWAAAARLFPDAEANCIIFPGWLHAHSKEEIGSELERIMRIGSRFPRFTFTLLELDARLAEGGVFEFHHAFRSAAERVRP